MSARTIVSWMIGVILLGTGVWCLYSTAMAASFALSSGAINGMPIDMRIMALVSSGVSIIFSCLFLFSGALNIVRSKEIKINYHPTTLGMATLILLIVLSIFARFEYVATSKISLEESRGLPLAFLTFTEIRGLCNTGLLFWKCRSFDSLNLLALITDVLIVYPVVCFGIQAKFELPSLNSKK